MSMIRKCLFPAAGYGTRFLPATKAMPKEMLPILNKPLIQYGVQEALQAGIRQIAFVTGRGKRAIEDHFDRNYEVEEQIQGTDKEAYLEEIRELIEECTFSYTRQLEIKGLGQAILTGETLIGEEPFAVVLADDLCVGHESGILSQMVAVYEKHRCSVVAIEDIDPTETERYGIVDGDLFEDNLSRVSNMVEKPQPNDAPSNHAIIGRYILTPNIFEILRSTSPGSGGEIQLTDALQTQAASENVLAMKIRGKRFDCGTVDGFVQATNHFYERFSETYSP